MTTLATDSPPERFQSQYFAPKDMLNFMVLVTLDLQSKNWFAFMNLFESSIYYFGWGGVGGDLISCSFFLG